MIAQWTGEIIGKMHCYRITAVELATEAGYTNRYLSMILNGHVEPKNAEKKIKDALDRIVERRKEKNGTF